VAFIHEHSDTTKNLGRWYKIVFDEEINKPVELRIRRLGREERKKIEKPFLRARKQRRGGQKVLEVPSSRLEDFVIEAAIYMWTDAKNLFVKPLDDGALSFYKKHLGEDGLEKGKDIRLDGKLDREVKLHLIDEDYSIATFITDKGILLDEEMADIDEAEVEREEAAAENL